MKDAKVNEIITQISTMLDVIKVMTNDTDIVAMQNQFYHLENQISYLKTVISTKKCCNSDFISWADISDDDVKKLNILNKICHKIQSELLDMYKASSVEVMSWLEKPSKASFRDYELPINITCYIGKGDQEWDDDADNILVSFNDTITIYELLKNVNDLSIAIPIAKPHSCIFHALYDHTCPRLSWKDMLRIKTIWAEIYTWKQCKFEISY